MIDALVWAVQLGRFQRASLLETKGGRLLAMACRADRSTRGGSNWQAQMCLVKFAGGTMDMVTMSLFSECC